MADVLSKLAVVITANTAQMTGQLKTANKSLGLMNSTLNTLKASLIGTFGAYQIVNGIRNAISTIAEFEKQMDKVRAITGATGTEFDKLEKNALDLGKSTEYTARQIAGLQVEYGRLGFSTKEILASTKATLNLATATGEDLSRSAEIAGSTLRAFQLDAEEMGRVTDVMTGTLNQSALALDTFADGMKYVAPVAEATNVSIEETSAMLGVLADAGIKGSQAGTSLRRIFTLLDKSGKPLAERMQELADRGITLADANDEVGLYAQTALLVLAKQNDKVKELTQSLSNVNGEAQRTADIMRDNLAGDADKFTSALEGLILEGSIFNELLREITQTGTGIINFFTGARDAADEYRHALHAFNTNGSFRDQVFGKNLESDLAVLRKLREEAGLFSSGADSPNPLVESYAGADFFAKELVKKTAEEVELRKQAAEAAEKQAQAAEKAARAALAEVEARSILHEAILARKNQDPSQTLGGFTSANPKVDISFNESVAASYDSITAAINRANAAGAANTEMIIAQQSEWYRFAEISGAAISQAIANDESLAKSAAAVTADILDASNKRIAAYLGEGIAKAFAINPIAGAAIATVGLAAISGLLRKYAKSSNGTSAGGASTTRATEVAARASYGAAQSSAPSPVLETQVRGQDLWVVLKNYESTKKSTHG